MTTSRNLISSYSLLLYSRKDRGQEETSIFVDFVVFLFCSHFCLFTCWLINMQIRFFFVSLNADILHYMYNTHITHAYAFTITLIRMNPGLMSPIYACTSIRAKRSSYFESERINFVIFQLEIYLEMLIFQSNLLFFSVPVWKKMTWFYNYSLSGRPHLIT